MLPVPSCLKCRQKIASKLRFDFNTWCSVSCKMFCAFLYHVIFNTWHALHTGTTYINHISCWEANFDHKLFVWINLAMNCFHVSTSIYSVDVSSDSHVIVVWCSSGCSLGLVLNGFVLKHCGQSCCIAK